LLAAFVRLLIRLIPWLSYDYRHRRVKRVQICVACGNRVRVRIQFHLVEKAVLCQCSECSATWGYNPIVKTEKWMKSDEEK